MLHDNSTIQDDDDISSGYYAELERRVKNNSPAMQYYNNYLEEQRQEKQQLEPIDESQQYVELHPSLAAAPAQEELVIPDDPSLVKPQTELTQDNQEPSLIERGWDKLPREAQMIAWPFMAPFVKGANEENPIARGVVEGTQNAAQGIVDLGRDITNALGGDFNEEDWLKIPRILESNPDSTTEAVVSGLAQFMSIFGMAGGIGKGATIAKQIAGGAFADASFDPTGGNLATLLRELDIDNSLTQFLDSKVGEDAEALERLEARGLQILEGAGIGFAIPALIGAVRWSKNKGAPWIKEFLQDSDPNLIPNVAETFGMPNPRKDMVSFHGSPHKFDKFDHSKMGSGQGAQSYGWGTYLAENPKVGKFYRDALSGNHMLDKLELYGKPASEFAKQSDVTEKIAFVLHKTEGNIKEAMKVLENSAKGKVTSVREKAKEAIQLLKTMNQDKVSWNPDGNLYEVDLPDSVIDDMLDWDADIDSQSDKVRELLLKIRKDYGTSFHDGEGAYDAVVFEMRTKGIENPKKAASEYLDSLGIKGIKFEDAGSRSVDFRVSPPNETKSGEWMVKDSTKPFSQGQHFALEKEALDYLAKKQKQTRNFVVFNDDNMKVLKRNDKKVKPVRKPSKKNKGNK